MNNRDIAQSSAGVGWTRASSVVRMAERAKSCARALGEGNLPAVAPEVVSGELANQMLPHIEADVRLAGAVAGPAPGALVAELSEQRRELGRLVEELDRLLLAAAARPHAAAPRRQVARAMSAVARLLDAHLSADRELWTALESAPEGSALAEEAEAGERSAARSLRFVWHPPVAPTEATAQRRNPKASRVVILGAGDAAAPWTAAPMVLRTEE